MLRNLSPVPRGRLSVLAVTTFFLVILSGCISGGSSSSGGGGGDSRATAVQPPVGDESITLSWVPPATRVDGSSLYLYELGGYEVHYGTADGRFRMSVSVPGQDSTGTTIKNLKSGIAYFFMVRVYDAEGRFSGFSPQRVITIP